MDDAGLCLTGLFEEKLADVRWELALEHVAHEALADVCSATFIAEYVTKGWNARLEALPVIVA